MTLNQPTAYYKARWSTHPLMLSRSVSGALLTHHWILTIFCRPSLVSFVSGTMLIASELDIAMRSRWCVVRELFRYRSESKCFIAQCMADREIQYILYQMWRQIPCPSSIRAQEFNLAVVRYPSLFHHVSFFPFLMEIPVTQQVKTILTQIWQYTSEQ